MWLRLFIIRPVQDDLVIEHSNGLGKSLQRLLLHLHLIRSLVVRIRVLVKTLEYLREIFVQLYKLFDHIRHVRCAGDFVLLQNQ